MWKKAKRINRVLGNVEKGEGESRANKFHPQALSVAPTRLKSNFDPSLQTQ